MAIRSEWNRARSREVQPSHSGFKSAVMGPTCTLIAVLMDLPTVLLALMACPCPAVVLLACVFGELWHPPADWVHLELCLAPDHHTKMTVPLQLTQELTTRHSTAPHSDPSFAIPEQLPRLLRM